MGDTGLGITYWLGKASEENFLSNPGIPGVRSMGSSVSNSLTHSLMFVNFVDGVTLADEDLNTNWQGKPPK